MVQEGIGIWIPVNLDLTGETSHGVGFNSDAWYAEFLAFDQCGASPTERIKNIVRGSKPEPLDVFAHQVWRERQYESIPIVCRSILGPKFVPVSVGCWSSVPQMRRPGRVVCNSIELLLSIRPFMLPMPA